MKYCAAKLSLCRRRPTIVNRFGLKKLSTLISRPRSFDEPVLEAPLPDSTSIPSENSSMIPGLITSVELRLVPPLCPLKLGLSEAASCTLVRPWRSLNLWGTTSSCEIPDEKPGWGHAIPVAEQYWESGQCLKLMLWAMLRVLPRLWNKIENLALFRCVSDLQCFLASCETAAPNSWHEDRTAPYTLTFQPAENKFALIHDPLPGEIWLGLSTPWIWIWNTCERRWGIIIFQLFHLTQS
jgi:hypothetical protein